jgi:peptidyl-prolyl cis-trans isomerase C/peptidyl-prolyl cis-trans isomerase SurA
VAQAKPLERPPAQELITASHILVSYAGATRSQATRSKDEARTLAGQLLARVRKGEDFGELAVTHSDDPTAKANRGNLGPSPASAWVKPFGDAALALRAGEVSDLVETPFGIHIIKRDK